MGTYYESQNEWHSMPEVSCQALTYDSLTNYTEVNGGRGFVFMFVAIFYIRLTIVLFVQSTSNASLKYVQKVDTKIMSTFN